MISYLLHSVYIKCNYLTELTMVVNRFKTLHAHIKEIWVTGTEVHRFKKNTSYLYLVALVSAHVIMLFTLLV